MSVPEHLTEAVTLAVTLVLAKLWDHQKGKKRDKSSGLTIERGFSELRGHIDTRCNSLELEIRTVSAHVIGPDGENGLRGDVREVKARVIGLEERERERLDRAVGAPDRRRA